MTRYLSGLCVASLGLCGGGWLIVAAVAFGGGSAGQAGRVNLLTGVGLVVVSGVSLICWATSWRRRMRVDGVLSDRFRLVSRRQARRNRRKLSRDVGRTARLAQRSAQEARRAARRSARLAGGGVLSSGEDVLSTGAELGSALGGDGPYRVAVSPGEAGESSGASAAELLSELRAMLVPLLTAAGEPPAGGQPAAPDASVTPDSPDAPVSPAPVVAPPVVAPPVVARPAVTPPAVTPPAAIPRQLPRRIPRPGFVPASVPAPSSPVAPLPAWPVAPSPASPAVASAEGDDLRFAADGEEAWW
jgi:hypothetical protein